MHCIVPFIVPENVSFTSKLRQLYIIVFIPEGAALPLVLVIITIIIGEKQEFFPVTFFSVRTAIGLEHRGYPSHHTTNIVKFQYYHRTFTKSLFGKFTLIKIKIF